MSTKEKENIKVIERYSQEIFNEGNLDAVYDLLADDYTHQTPPPGVAPTREGFKEFVSTAQSALDNNALITDDIFAYEDKVVQRWRTTGVHTGTFLGVPASNKSVEFSGISLYTVRNGKIVEDWTLFDMVGLMQQIGAMEGAPEPAF
jgi:steroid delta-isomerase-like uncharacterized protein